MAIAFLDLAASIPIKASLYSNMARPLCAEDRLGQSEQPSSRIVGRATSSAAERTYGHTCAPPRMRSSPQRRRPAPSWLGLMAATCAAGTGRSATSRWSQARSSTPGVRSTALPSPATVRRLRPRRSGRRSWRPGCRRTRRRTVLCDGDAGLWRLQREALPSATIVLDWWHAAVRFEHALQAARGLGAGTADASLAHDAVRTLDRAKW